MWALSGWKWNTIHIPILQDLYKIQENRIEFLTKYSTRISRLWPAKNSIDRVQVDSNAFLHCSVINMDEDTQVSFQKQIQ